jgi:hypothetical protein
VVAAPPNPHNIEGCKVTWSTVDQRLQLAKAVAGGRSRAPAGRSTADSEQGLCYHDLRDNPCALQGRHHGQGMLKTAKTRFCRAGTRRCPTCTLQMLLNATYQVLLRQLHATHAGLALKLSASSVSACRR